MGFLDGTPFWSRGQDGFRQDPQNMDPLAEALPKKTVMNIDGEQVPFSRTEIVNDPLTGKLTEIIYVEVTYDAYGNLVPLAYLTAKSWKNERVPEERSAICANPFGLHKGEPRRIAIGKDGIITPKTRTPLCDDCVKENEKNKTIRRWTAWLWRPDIY